MKHSKLICHLKLFYCVFALCFIQLLIGSAYTFPLTMFEGLRQSSSTIKLSIDDESWITSVPMLACPVGLIITAIMTDKFGRLFALKFAYVPMILGWTLLVFADSFVEIMITRILIGLPFGISANVLLYVSEVCPAGTQRTMYSSMAPVALSVGIMVRCLLSFGFRWRTLAGVLAGAGAVNFVALFTLPESPGWLRSKGRTDEAAKADEWFFGPGNVPTVATVATTNDTGAAVPAKPFDWSRYADRAVWKPASITLAFFACQQGTGVYMLLFYSTDAIRDCQSSLNGNVASVLLASARVLGITAYAVLYTVGRRTVVGVSGAGTAASLFALVAYKRTFHDVRDAPYPGLLAVAHIAFMFFGLFGVMPMPWRLSAEVFPAAAKGVMSVVVQTCGYLLCFTVSKMYPSLVSAFGMDVVWSVFFCFCVLSVLFAVFIMPETQKKSLDEILSSMNV